jgi:hypothetical protein
MMMAWIRTEDRAEAGSRAGTAVGEG